MLFNVKVIELTKEFVKEKLKNDSSGHDWMHIERVLKNAIFIAKCEKDVDIFVVQLAALLHDIADWKFCGGDEELAPKIASEFLRGLDVEKEVIYHICDIIKNISYKGQGTQTLMQTREGQIVQDADRLDAMGAIGVARTFAYGGFKNRAMYNPEVKPEVYQTFEQYKKNNGPTINHFYEKLLHLKDRMNTDTAKQMAHKRHIFMEIFLKEFFEEIG